MAAMAAAEKLATAKAAKGPESPVSGLDFGKIAQKIVSFLARNFFTMKFIALAIAFTINFMLLFYKVNIFCRPFIMRAPRTSSKWLNWCLQR